MSYVTSLAALWANLPVLSLASFMCACNRFLQTAAVWESTTKTWRNSVLHSAGSVCVECFSL